MEKFFEGLLLVFCQKTYPLYHGFVTWWFARFIGDEYIVMGDKHGIGHSRVCIDTRVGTYGRLFNSNFGSVWLLVVAYSGSYLVSKYVNWSFLRTVLFVAAATLVGIVIMNCVCDVCYLFKDETLCSLLLIGTVGSVLGLVTCVCYFVDLLASPPFGTFFAEQAFCMSFGLYLVCSLWLGFMKCVYLSHADSWIPVADGDCVEFVGFKNPGGCGEGFVMDDLRTVDAFVDKKVVIRRLNDESERIYKLSPIKGEKQKIISGDTVYVWDEHEHNWVEESK